MIQATLLFLLRDQEICLGMKTSGFGTGRWNGFGGKIEEGETKEEAAVREMQEESGVVLSLNDVEYVADLTLYNSAGAEPPFQVHVFFARVWQGDPQEIEKMRPKWFPLEQIPYEEMWPDDPYWLPRVLQGEKLKATFWLNEDNTKIVDSVIEPRI